MATVIPLPLAPTTPEQITDATKPTQRAKIWHNVAVRLADEGVPLRAIVRALMLPYAEVREALAGACERGMLLNIPHDDWPIGTRREERAPDLVPLKLEDEHMVMLAIRTFGLTPTMARILVALLRRPEMTKNSLHIVTQHDEGRIYPNRGKEPSDIKIVDVYICKMRKYYLPPEVEIITIWGIGYYMTPAGKDAAFKAMGVKHDTFSIPADAISDKKLAGVNQT